MLINRNKIKYKQYSIYFINIPNNYKNIKKLLILYTKKKNFILMLLLIVDLFL